MVAKHLFAHESSTHSLPMSTQFFQRSGSILTSLSKKTFGSLRIQSRTGPPYPNGKASGLKVPRFETRFHCASAVYVGLLPINAYLGGQTSSRWCDPITNVHRLTHRV
ncbi:hypothetical protein AVEN_220581-1 [Araneus ventricosus]|uniref:Uncharacterized protein n=1 Tax=Araneus ventricosus TaxID=182803 RepID=A0A4Y2M3I6_ARAVE|nr:hypothetical protein AVEN_220581-1 [Araneus ventricosus]